MKQLNLFDENQTSIAAPTALPTLTDHHRLESKYARLLREELHLGALVSYVGNKNIPILRLYRYKEAFAFRFVEEFISRFGLTSSDYVFDPFCGMGTTLFTASQKGIPSIGVDRLPIAVSVARTLPLFYSLKPGEMKEVFEKLTTQVDQAPPAAVALDVAIMRVAFPPDTLLTLRRWKTVIDDLGSPVRDVFLLLLFSVLEPCSYTSKDGQFLRLIRDKKVADPAEALQAKVNEAERDIQLAKNFGWDQSVHLPSVCLGDTRDLRDVTFHRQPTALITSPPYANRYDYTRTYSLELCFHFVHSFAELKALRFGILRSHIESKVYPYEKAPHPAVSEVVHVLRERVKQLNNPRVPDMLTGLLRGHAEGHWRMGPGIGARGESRYGR